MPGKIRSGTETRPVARFRATLFTIPGKGGWTFAPVPAEHAPQVVGPWGRTPVIARAAQMQIVEIAPNQKIQLLLHRILISCV